MCSPHTVSSSIRARSSRFVCVALLLGAAAGRASAQSVLVDFEQLATAPCTFDMTTALHDELASLGIHFSGPTTLDGGGVLDQCGTFVVNAHSGIKFLAFNTTGGPFIGGGTPVDPETVSFDQRVTHVDLWVASGTGQATFQIQAFDGAALVGSNTINTGSFWTPLSVSVTAGFTRVVLDSNDSVFLYDDLSFTPGTTPALYCFGDGSGTACPCANAGLNGNGCASSVNPSGANLSSMGAASIGTDTFVLHSTGMPNSSALYFQGTSRTAGGAGSVFGDGLRCAGGSIVRIGSKLNSGGSSSYPVGADTPISVKGANSAGNVRDYQVWYRNSAAFCTPSTFNLTNGLEITWGP